MELGGSMWTWRGFGSPNGTVTSRVSLFAMGRNGAGRRNVPATAVLAQTVTGFSGPHTMRWRERERESDSLQTEIHFDLGTRIFRNVWRFFVFPFDLFYGIVTHFTPAGCVLRLVGLAKSAYPPSKFRFFSRRGGPLKPFPF